MCVSRAVWHFKFFWELVPSQRLWQLNQDGNTKRYHRGTRQPFYMCGCHANQLFWWRSARGASIVVETFPLKWLERIIMSTLMGTQSYRRHMSWFAIPCLSYTLATFLSWRSDYTFWLKNKALLLTAQLAVDNNWLLTCMDQMIAKGLNVGQFLCCSRYSINIGPNTDPRGTQA